MTTNVVYKETI